MGRLLQNQTIVSLAARRAGTLISPRYGEAGLAVPLFDFLYTSYKKCCVKILVQCFFYFVLTIPIHQGHRYNEAVKTTG